jgi:hypothetical protein
MNKKLQNKNMRSIWIGVSFLTITLLIFSCSGTKNKSDKSNETGSQKIKQLADGSIKLGIDKASCYNNVSDPSCNAAEWNIIITKPGLYQVWLSSATIDTMDLQYNNSVTISLQEKRLNVKPVLNKIVANAGELNYPYYRADSYIGEFYIPDPGEYSIQIISDKVIARSDSIQGAPGLDHTKVISVFLTPMTR